MMLNVLTVFLSVIDRSFGVVRLAVKGPSHFQLVSLFNLTASPVLVRHFVAAINFDLNTFFILFSDTMVSSRF